MKQWLVCVALAAAVGAGLVEEDSYTDSESFYHEDVGIAAAERIRRAEEAANINGTSVRIAGGSPVTLGEYPFMGGLLILLTSGTISVCGSSLLSTSRLVTAAHCWWDGQNQAREFIVVLGSTRLFSGGVRVETNQVEMHPSYNLINRTNDVAIIRINPIAYTDVIGPVALPNGDLRLHDFANWWVEVIGFGVGGDSASDIFDANQGLSHVTVRVTTAVVCTASYPQALASTLCAIGDAVGRNACSGDSGGPLVYTGGVRPVLVGIKSYGWNLGCTINRPSAYARVTSFNTWIRIRI